jgi:muconate cycloisomerase
VRFEIDSISTTIVDLPIRRTHGIGAFTMNCQSTVIVQVRTADGAIGLGEGVVPGGGPQWGGESVETIQQVIDRYLAPTLIGKSFTGVNDVVAALTRVTACNNFSVAAIEMALWDLTGKYFGCSVGDLLGGLRRESIDVLWSIGSNVADPLEEALKYADNGHKCIKFMLGTRDPRLDCARVTDVIPHLPADTTIIADFSGKWDAATARRWLPVLAEAGVGIAEQPLAPWDIGGSQWLSNLAVMLVMADEGVRSVNDAFAVASARAADVIAVKVPKLGGITGALKTCAVAEASAVAVYGGGTMESSIGTSAAAQLFGTFATLVGCDIIGPLLMTDDIVTEPITYRSGQLHIPHAPGLGLQLDMDKMKHYARS